MAVLLRDEAVTIEHRGRRIQVVGMDAVSYARREARPWALADPGADLRILLSHFPAVERRLPEGAFHLVLAGHLHAGQIVLPYPGGRVTLAHPSARLVAGVYQTRDDCAPRLTRHRDDVRSVPLLREAGGDRARTSARRRRATITLMEGHSSISSDVIARYAEDAALETDGVTALVVSERGKWRHRGARVTDDENGGVAVELHLVVDWGANVPAVGHAVQDRVAEYLGRMTDLTTAKIDVVVDDIGPPPAEA